MTQLSNIIKLLALSYLQKPNQKIQRRSLSYDEYFREVVTVFFLAKKKSDGPAESVDSLFNGQERARRDMGKEKVYYLQSFYGIGRTIRMRRKARPEMAGKFALFSRAKLLS